MIQAGDRPLDVAVTKATINSGESVSSVVDLGGLHLCGILMPAAWTAAAITIQSSYDDGGTWRNLYDVSGEVSIPADVNRHIAIELGRFVGLGAKIRLRSGTSGAAVNQGGARELLVVSRAL